MRSWGKIAAYTGLGMVLGAAGLGFANAAGPEGGLGRGMRLARMMRQLGIQPAQAKELRSAAIRFMVERRALDMEDLSPAERKERMFRLRRGFLARAEKTLTPEQKTKLKARFEEMRSARLQRFEHKVSQVAAKLELTTEQREQARTLIQETREQVEALKADPKLDDPTRLATAIGVLEETRTDLYRLLTPEQQEKAKDLLEKVIQERIPAGPL
jgi:Spy/CpxP family protein refolding chaperone